METRENLEYKRKMAEKVIGKWILGLLVTIGIIFLIVKSAKNHPFNPAPTDQDLQTKVAQLVGAVAEHLPTSIEVIPPTPTTTPTDLPPTLAPTLAPTTTATPMGWLPQVEITPLFPPTAVEITQLSNCSDWSITVWAPSFSILEFPFKEGENLYPIIGDLYCGEIMYIRVLGPEGVVSDLPLGGEITIYSNTSQAVEYGQNGNFFVVGGQENFEKGLTAFDFSFPYQGGTCRLVFEIENH